MPITINGSGTIGGPTTFTDNVTLGTSLLATPSGATPSYLCRAWVNFNGTGTVAIRASGNVTSITDNGTGDYTVNFTTAMPDANYCALVTPSNDPVAQIISNTKFFTPSSFGLNTLNQNTTGFADNSLVSVAIFR